MELPAGNPPCRVFLLGPMTVLDRTGAVCTPKGQKVRALLAMLALAPRGARSRVWLRDKLWSDREEEQAGANLRQALTEWRRALGPAAQDILVADKNTISLQMSSVWVDVRALHEDGPSRLEASGLRQLCVLAQAIARALDLHHHRAVEQAVEERGGHNVNAGV
jgi:DNA-binding SARP family transcriptional activator